VTGLLYHVSWVLLMPALLVVTLTFTLAPVVDAANSEAIRSYSAASSALIRIGLLCLTLARSAVALITAGVIATLLEAMGAVGGLQRARQLRNPAVFTAVSLTIIGGNVATVRGCSSCAGLVGGTGKFTFFVCQAHAGTMLQQHLKLATATVVVVLGCSGGTAKNTVQASTSDFTTSSRS